MSRAAGLAGPVDARQWWARLAAKNPLLGVMPPWLIVTVLALPALGFWLGLTLKAQPPQSDESVAPPVVAAPAQAAPPKTVGMRHLRFVDVPDKSVSVIDADTGVEVYRVTGEAGFIRGIMRGMARERRRLGKGPDQPFELSLNAGLLTLRDLATGEQIELTAFGSTNAGAFARMLVEPPASAMTESPL